jgi:hypothetical protein
MNMAKTSEPNRYSKLIEAIFFKYYRPGAMEVIFEREDINRAAEELKIKLPKNLGDVLYTFRYRAALPDSIANLAPEGRAWIIRPAGRSKYRIALAAQTAITPSPAMAETKIPDATPGIIAKYAFNDEQAALAKIRYNRLIDIFTGITCYSLQSHLRTTVPEMGQVETDEIYIGIDKRGAHYILPIQAKGRKDKIGLVQIEQDLFVCEAKFPGLICRPIAAQMLSEDTIALIELERDGDTIKVVSEKHYRLVKPKDLSNEELQTYQARF